jgi:hypothetical protein
MSNSVSQKLHAWPSKKRSTRSKTVSDGQMCDMATASLLECAKGQLNRKPLFRKRALFDILAGGCKNC